MPTAAAAAGAVPTATVPAAVPTAVPAVLAAAAAEAGPTKKTKADQTNLEMFKQVIDQKNTFWDTITTDQLVWHQNHPAIVVPERMHFSAPTGISFPKDGVMAHGPSSSGVRPAENRECRGVVVVVVVVCSSIVLLLLPLLLVTVYMLLSVSAVAVAAVL